MARLSATPRLVRSIEERMTIPRSSVSWTVSSLHEYQSTTRSRFSFVTESRFTPSSRRSAMPASGEREAEFLLAWGSLEDDARADGQPALDHRVESRDTGREPRHRIIPPADGSGRSGTRGPGRRRSRLGAPPGRLPSP